MTAPSPPAPPQFPGFEDPKAARAAAKAYAKATRPAYKKKRFIIPAAIAAISIMANAGGGGDETVVTPTAAETQTDAAPAKAAPAKAAPAAKKPAAAKLAEPAIQVSAKELIAVLEGNALKAKNTYNGKQVIVTGFVGSIDASGDYFSLLPEADAFVLTGVQAYTSEKFMDQVANFTEGQPVTVTGKITDVGEIMGYELKVASIK